MAGGSGAAGQDQWKPEELDLRRREVRYGGLVGLAEVVIGVSAIAATLIAGYAAVKAGQAVEVATRGIEQQAIESRLSTAIASIGGDQPAERVAGFSLLRRHVQEQVTTATTDEDRRDAHDLYTTALDVLENYLRNQQAAPAGGGAPATAAASAGRGFGIPRVPPDNVYAANELRALLNLKTAVGELRRTGRIQSPAPSVDLANAQLFGLSWARIDFSWLGSGYFPGIDLRGANLSGSVWGESTLDRAFLQCANLEGAVFSGTRLVDADLRGASLAGANFTGAVLDGAKFTGATGWDRAIGLDKARLDPPAAGVARTKDGTDACLRHEEYWAQKPPAPGR